MYLAFLIIALIGVLILLFHITLEFNKIDKNMTALIEHLKKHYE
ncbi:MAG: hypothetical protein ACOCW2_01155 [Chitinivibrionales bacterium]